MCRHDGGNQSRWLKVKVRGRRNRFGLGALVRVDSAGKQQMQQIGSQPSFLSQNSLTAHFGLGTAETVERIRVLFPGGRVVERRGVPTNQTLTITEEEGRAVS